MGEIAPGTVGARVCAAREWARSVRDRCGIGGDRTPQHASQQQRRRGRREGPRLWQRRGRPLQPGTHVDEAAARAVGTRPQRLEAEAVAVERGARGCLGQQQEHLQHARPDGGALSVGGQLAW